jgi:hypothetical protein
MSGLFAALYLRRRGWEADVFERSPAPLSGRGAGIMTHPEMRDALAELGIDSSSNFGVPIERRVVLDRAGEVIAERTCPQTATSWNRLFEMLGAAFGGEHYHLGKDLRGVEQTAEGITARFADGSVETADVLVGADGFRSGVRAQLLSQAQPLYAGYVAWRGLADERSLASVLPRDIFASLAFYLPPGEQFLGYPVAGPGNDLRPATLSWNIVWYRPADEAAEVPRLLTDESGHTHELSIPPPLVARSVVAAMREAASGCCLSNFAPSCGASSSPSCSRSTIWRARACLRPSGSDRRRGVRGPPACRSRHRQGGAGCRRACRRAPGAHRGCGGPAGLRSAADRGGSQIRRPGAATRLPLEISLRHGGRAGHGGHHADPEAHACRDCAPRFPARRCPQRPGRREESALRAPFAASCGTSSAAWAALMRRAMAAR